MRDYTVTIAESIKELTARERISLKSFDTAVPLDKVTEDAPVRFTVENVVTCDVHNERAKKDQNKDQQDQNLLSLRFSTSMMRWLKRPRMSLLPSKSINRQARTMKENFSLPAPLSERFR